MIERIEHNNVVLICYDDKTEAEMEKYVNSYYKTATMYTVIAFTVSAAMLTIASLLFKHAVDFERVMCCIFVACIIQAIRAERKVMNRDKLNRLSKALKNCKDAYAIYNDEDVCLVIEHKTGEKEEIVYKDRQLEKLYDSKIGFKMQISLLDNVKKRVSVIEW